MKKILLLGLMGLMGLSGSRAHGQMIIDMWNMTTGVDTTLWYDIDGVDSVIITAGDKTSAQSGLVNIGFPFTLGVSTYSQFSTNINGTVRLGSTPVPASGGYSNALNQNNGPKIEPFGYRGRFDNNCYTRMALLGTAGHRVLVVETRMKDYYYFSDSLYVSFQVQLFEAGGLRVVYGEADSGAVYTTTSARLQNGVSAGVNSNNKDIIFIDFATHEAVRLNASCSLHNAAAAWPEKGRWYNLFYDSTLCPYPPAISTTGNNPADITLTCANGVSDLHILIPAVGIDTVWPATESYLSLGGVFNPTTTYNGTVQSICANGRTSYRTRAFSFSTGCGVVHYLPWSAGFQTAAATNCWTVPEGSNWMYLDISTSSHSYNKYICSSSYPVGADNWIISGDIVIPAYDTTNVVLEWGDAAYTSQPYLYRYSVLVTTAADPLDSATVWDTLYSVNAASLVFNSNQARFTTRQVDISPYAGQTIHVAFRHQPFQFFEDFQDLQRLCIDNVTVRETNMPVVSVSAPAVEYGDEVVYTATLVEGNHNGLTCTWHSTLLDSTWVISGFDGQSVFDLVYAASGTDTVTVIVSNAYGADTAVAVTDVRCCAVRTVPWVEDFATDGNRRCWTNQSSFESSGTWVAYLGGINMLISPAFDMPDTAYDVQLRWTQLNSSPQDAVTMIVLVSPTGGMELSDFTDTLFYATHNSGTDSLLLGQAYAGQRIRVAFNMETSYMSHILLSDIAVNYSTAAPEVAVVAPRKVSIGDRISFAASLQSGARNGLSFTWHSTLLNTTWVDNGIDEQSEFNVVYPVAGVDTVIVIVTNAYSADTTAAVVQVLDCSPRSLPYNEDLEGVTAVNYATIGDLPDCWYATWNGSNAAYAPHVISNSGYPFISGLPDNTLFMGAFTGYGNQAEVLLPRFADSLHRLMMAFDYRFEANTGTLVVGYYDDTVFTAVDTLARHTGNYRRDTVSFAMHSIANNPHIAIRWQSNFGAFYGVAIDNIEVFVDSTFIPLTPDTVWRTVTVFCDSTMGSVSGSGTYMDSSMVTITATANDGYHFTSWNDGDTHVVRNILLVSDTAFTAHFAADTLPTPPTPDTLWRTVTVHMLLDSGDTLFEADVVSVTGAGSYPDSTLVTLTAYYDNYYPYFWYWVTPANDTLYDNPYSFVVTSDTVINAIFGPMCVGINGTEGAAPDVAIHPNPATGDAYVSVGVPSTVTVVDLQGRTVLQPTHVASSLCLQQGTLPKGIYFVSVSNSVGAVVKKLVIQ